MAGYSLFPLMARRAGVKAVPVAGGTDAILAAVNERTRAVAIASPNDPTGHLMTAGELTGLLDALPERVAVLLDEALIDFAAPQAQPACAALLALAPRLLVFRSFSKAWGLAGLRCGYALGGPGAEELLAALQPELGLDELAQAGALESLRSADELVRRHAADLVRERDRLTGELRDLGLRRARERKQLPVGRPPVADRRRGGDRARPLRRDRRPGQRARRGTANAHHRS